MIVVGILGLAAVIVVCIWVVIRDPEAMRGRSVQERARSLEQLASGLRREASHPSPEPPRAVPDEERAVEERAAEA